ncbi:MAG: histidinol dehydrogenase [Chloroflexota bacterium]|nr:histidinol dehydrogenase [Chloroflexota bacterium]
MKIIKDIEVAKATLLKRSPLEFKEVSPQLQESIYKIFQENLSPTQAVERIIDEVRLEGDHAICKYSKHIDGIKLSQLEVTKDEIDLAYNKVRPDLMSAINIAAERIRSFHENCRRRSWIEFDEGGIGQLIRPIDCIGAYVPGGSASYPSTALMTVIPAKAAGVREVIVTTPPNKDGIVPASTLVAADISGADRIFKVGGAQAIAALAFGTQSIPRADKICGPGNIFVQLAKKLLFGTVGIDGIYGPTETMVLADDTASPSVCAADLLAQAEHDPLSAAILITPSSKLATSVSREVKRQLTELERKDIASISIQDNGGIVVTKDMDEAIQLVNLYAPEHLTILVQDAWTCVGKIKNAGGVFVGEFSAESLGDYIAGPSHVMPTGGTARFGSPLSVDDFVKIISVVALDKNPLMTLGTYANTIADVEGLTGHSKSVSMRLEQID